MALAQAFPIPEEPPTTITEEHGGAAAANVMEVMKWCT
eukprot:CAMPEP_0119321138 /NCGR_PEP_ID=MMETSP1333-20130426/54537_1 /TAXON_ID=418940 /ORGANISM="Scyphosphaera apsteinii, Strain RCC1455" /LENGTH=37 /DNA_ID= /DNA_START= /DNA_END= /DNA_ORIENTATION=